MSLAGSRSDRRFIPAATISTLFRQAWAGVPPAELARLIEPHTNGRGEAVRLCREWMPRPPSGGGDLPSQGPTGLDLPSPPMPWPWHLSPLPGVAFAPDDVIDVALAAVDPADSGSGVGTGWLGRFHRLIETDGVPRFVRERLAGQWQATRALACLRAAFPPRHPPGWLTPVEMERFVRHLAAPSGRGGTDRDRSRFLAWSLLVRSGAEPAWARAAVARWRPWDVELPTGQWLPPELMPEARSVVTEVAGLPITPELFARILEHLPGSTVAAGRLLQVRLGCSPRAARDAISEIASTVRSARPRPHRVRQVAEGEGTSRHDVEARELLDAAINGLLLDLPFHWSVLQHALIVEDASHPTMAVGTTSSSELVLFYNPEFLHGLSTRERQGVLAHEIHHVILGHLTPKVLLGRRLSESLETADGQRCWTLACEATANEFVPYPLPGTPITIDQLGLPPMEGTVERYRRLRRRKKKPDVPGCGGVIRGVFERLPRHHRDLAKRGGERAPKNTLRAAAEEVGGAIDATTRQLLQSGGWTPLVEEALRPSIRSELPWNALLRTIAASLKSRQPTRRYPSRRAPDRLGIVPGRRNRRERPIVLAAVDTSASMSREELEAATAELQGLLRASFRVACLQCDVEIRDRRWLTRGVPLQRVYGRGGTDLRPPFAPAILRHYQPDLIVYFTDGLGDAPAEGPPNTPVLWVLTGESPEIPARWGRVVTMRAAAARKLRLAPAPPNA